MDISSRSSSKSPSISPSHGSSSPSNLSAHKWCYQTSASPSSSSSTSNQPSQPLHPIRPRLKPPSLSSPPSHFSNGPSYPRNIQSPFRPPPPSTVPPKSSTSNGSSNPLNFVRPLSLPQPPIAPPMPSSSNDIPNLLRLQRFFPSPLSSTASPIPSISNGLSPPPSPAVLPTLSTSTSSSKPNRLQNPCPSEDALTCSVCKEVLSDNLSFERHLRTHNNEKPYKCTTCGTEFRWNMLFMRHQKYCHSMSNEVIP